MDDPHEQTAENIDARDEKPGDRISTHELRRAVHRSVEVRLARQLVSPTSRFVVVDQPGGEVPVDAHLATRHRVERKARGDLSHPAGTFGNDDEVDPNEDQEDDDTDRVVPADHELAERLDDRARFSSSQDQPRRADVQRKSIERQDQQDRREGGEVQRTVRVERDEENQQ